jgi:hypothetical protein
MQHFAGNSVLIYGEVFAMTEGRLARGKAFILDDSRCFSRAEEIRQ